MKPKTPVALTGIEADDASNPISLAGKINCQLACIGLTGGSAALQWSLTAGGTYVALVDADGDAVTITVSGQVIDVWQSVPFLRVVGSSMTGSPAFYLFSAEP